MPKDLLTTADELPVDHAQRACTHPELWRVVQMADVALTALDLAETSIMGLSPNDPTDTAREWMVTSGFDIAPIEEPQRSRFVTQESLLNPGRVGDVALSIPASMVVTGELGLTACLSLLKTKKWFFVLERDELTGIVTKADVDRPSVAMTMLAFILSAERGLDRLIDRYLPDEAWKQLLNDKQLQEVGNIHAQRQRRNAQTTELSCASFSHRKWIVKKSRVRSALGLSRDKFDEWAQDITQARDGLAHASGLLSIEPDTDKAIGLYERTREFAELTWAAVDRSEES